MSKEIVPGWNTVSNRFGPRVLPEGKAGVLRTDGAIIQVTLDFSATNFNDDDIEVPILPAGFKAVRAFVHTKTAGDSSSTDDELDPPVLNVGTDTTEATNGFSVDQASLNTAGVYTITSFSGTWASRLSAATSVGLALSGAGAAITAGKYKIVIEGYSA